jgi:hypothetical protein
MRSTALLTVLAALAVPTAALATKPTTPNPNAATPKVTYVLRGTLTAYTANSSVTIAVHSAVYGTNHAAKALKGQTVTLTVDSSTKVTLHNGVFTPNDKGIVEFRATKGLTTATGQKATKIVDQGPAHT